MEYPAKKASLLGKKRKRKEKKKKLKDFYSYLFI